MPGPPIRKPSDHSPPAGSPRNIAGHHVLHRPLMPRHPPNAQKNKQQRHTNKTRNTLSQKSYSKMLASTIQFTTNPPTPTHNPQQQTRSPRQVRQPGRTAPEPRQHATPTPRRDTHHHQTRQQRARLLCHHQATNPTPAPTTQARHQSTSQPPCFPRAATPRPARTQLHGPDKIKRPGSHPHTTYP